MDERSASRARVGARATSNAARGRVTFGVAFAHGCTRTQTHTRTRDASPRARYDYNNDEDVRTNERTNEVFRRGMRACDASRRVSASRCAWNL